MVTTAAEPRYAVVNGQRVLVVESEGRLPQKLDQLLADMAKFGFAYRDDIVPRGTSTSCTVLQEHRFARFREGRWWNPRRITVYGSHPGSQRVIEPGLLLLRLEMCQDCGAVCVRDVSPEMAAGARPARLTNLKTGAERIAPAVGQRNVVLGWYSGARPNKRTYGTATG
jgi:hypothetical protein